MDIAIRPFAPQDQARLTELVMALYQEDPEGEPMNSAKVERTCRYFANHPDRGQIYCVESNGKLVGYTIVLLNWSNEFGGQVGQVDELYVKPEYRNRGLGTEVMQYIAQTYRQTARALQVEVTPGNRRAVDFYHRLGFIKKPASSMVKLL